MKTAWIKYLLRNIIGRHYFPLICFVILLSSNAVAQCPLNIDFEKGSFTGWQCYTGFIFFDRISLGPSSPDTNRHLIIAAPNSETDYFGGFPKLCPNGSGFSVRLGNDGALANAESISYTFTIPPGQNDFSLVYNYAVVFEDPGHAPNEQPRLRIEVMNITDNKIDPCSSFDFVATASIPGFKTSDKRYNADAPVRYKDWSAAYINLKESAGKTFKITFTTTDCSKRGHFGYAYIDINSVCNSTPQGSVFCPDDKFVDLVAPPGFQTYSWFNTAHTVLGTQQHLILTPIPRSGDTIMVAFTPYNGYGCIDTLTALLSNTLSITANAGPDTVFCANPAIKLGIKPTPGEMYSWSPAAGLSNPNISNPVASPGFSTQYTLTAINTGGGCRSTDVVELVKKCDVIDFYVPSAFTPNGDGKNDRLSPVLYGYSKVNYFRIYNRYGQLLYSSASDQPGWDGNIHGKPAATQTVVWMIEAVDAYNKIERRQGTTVLIR